jgi:mono/diheme cytochrome c family protein
MLGLFMQSRAGSRLKPIVKVLAAACLVLSFLNLQVTAQNQPSDFTPSDEQPEDYPQGHGREETFYACTACHGFKLVAQQGMLRRQWDDTLNLMIERHNMPPLDAKDRELVLDYLESTFGPRATRQRGWQNPFIQE